MSVFKYTAPHRGVTLVELLVTLALLGVLASVATLALRIAASPDPADPRNVVADSMRVSAASGRTISVRMRIRGQDAAASVRPDGSIIADSEYHIDPTTGLPNNAK
jgi:prepilin-type N-terminal cleavage/methylation domain-containing protein